MNRLKNIVGALGVVVPLALSIGGARAEDTLKVVIGQINNWENQAPTLGQDAGIFKKHGLVLENTGTQGAGETIQAVISGSADIGGGVGAAGVMRAFAKGAPVRILAPAFTGTGDLYWYVKADSKLQTLKDATAENTIAYSTNGSSRVHQRTRRKSQTNGDRRTSGHADCGHVWSDRHRLGGAAIWPARDQRRENPDFGAGQ